MRARVEQALKKLLPRGTNPNVTYSDDALFGHYSSNVAFVLAKQKGQSPMEVAEGLRDRLSKSQTGKLFERIEVVRPGFLNFWLEKSFLHKEIRVITKQGERYGRLRKAHSGARVQVEFVSANPTGPLTLANGRGGFLGDVLSNVLEWCGNHVEREYYINDTGNQIVTFGKSLLAANNIIPKEESFYRGAYVKEWASNNKKTVSAFSNNPLRLGQIAAKDFLLLIKKALVKKARINFTRFTSELRDIHKKKFVGKTMKIFESRKLTYTKDGAIWLKTSSFGDDKDRVLVTKDGFPTYFLADAGHYLETKERGFRTKINILGPDHYGYVKRIQAAADIVGISHSHIIVTQAVRIMNKGKEKKMSKRRGEFITFDSLLNDVGVDTTRFFFLMISPDTHIDFDLKLAKERSLKNPVYYAQYAYVRAVGILKKGRVVREVNPKYNLLSAPEEIILIRQLARFPEVLVDTAHDYYVHRITRYVSEMARAFHAFYEHYRIVGEKSNVAAARYELVLAFSIVFGNALRVLGVTAPKKM